MKVYYRGQRGEGIYDVAFEGLIRNVERRYRETGSEITKQEYETYMRITPCKACHGQRLKKESLAVTVAGKNISEITSMSVKNLYTFIQEMNKLTHAHDMDTLILKYLDDKYGTNSNELRTDIEQYLANIKHSSKY